MRLFRALGVVSYCLAIPCLSEEYFFFTDPGQTAVRSAIGIDIGVPVEGVPATVSLDSEGVQVFTFLGDLNFESDDSIRFDRLHTANGVARPVRIVVVGDLVIPEGMTVDASAVGRSTFAGGGEGGESAGTGGVAGAGGSGGAGGAFGEGGAGAEAFDGDSAELGMFGRSGSQGEHGGSGGDGLSNAGGHGFGTTASGGVATNAGGDGGRRGYAFFNTNLGSRLTTALGGDGGPGTKGANSSGGTDGASGMSGVGGGLGVGGDVSTQLTGGGGGSSGGGGGAGGGGGGGQGGGGGAGGNGGDDDFVSSGGDGGRGGAGSAGSDGFAGSPGRDGGAGGGGGGGFEFVVHGSITLGGQLLSRGGNGEPGNGSLFPSSGTVFATLAGEDGEPGEIPFSADDGGMGGSGGSGGAGSIGGAGGGSGDGGGGSGGVIQLTSNMIRLEPSMRIDLEGGSGGGAGESLQGEDGRLVLLSEGSEVVSSEPLFGTSRVVTGGGAFTADNPFEVGTMERPLLGDLKDGPATHGVLAELTATEFMALPQINSQLVFNAGMVIFRIPNGISPYNFSFNDDTEWVFIANISGVDLVEPKFIAGRNSNPLALPDIAAGEVFAMTIGADVTQFAASHNTHGTVVSAFSDTFDEDVFHLLSAGLDELLVTTTADELDEPAGAHLSLREAIRDASGNEVIRFSSSVFNDSSDVISLSMGQLEITKQVRLDASGLRHGVRIDASGQGHRVMQVTEDGSLSLIGVTVSGGSVNSLAGGGLILNQGSLEARNSAFVEGESTVGGAINNSGSCILTNCTIAGCSLGGSTSSFANGMAIFNNSNGVLALTHCSVSGNSGRENAYAIVAGGVDSLNNTIVAFNVAGGDNSDANILGAIEMESGNNFLIGDPRLQLVDDGSFPTPILLPIFNPLPENNSPVIDAVTNGFESRDQSGITRPHGAGPDIGAAEALYLPVVDTLEDTNGTPGVTTSLREAFTFASPGSTITFAPTLSGGTLHLSLGVLDFPESLTGQGLTVDASDLPDGVVIDGEDQTRLFDVSPFASAVIRGLTLTGADDSAIRSEGSLTIVDCTFHDNEGTQGGAVQNAGTASSLSIANSTFVDNTADTGGAIYSENSAVIRNVTITRNFATDASGIGGGGIHQTTSGLTMMNSIVSANASASGEANIAAASFVEMGANLLNHPAPMLGELVDNGGPTPTVLPRIQTFADSPSIFSPAINASVNGASLDQRGVLAFEERDLGAAELRYREVEHNVDENGEPGGNGLSLREALTTVGGTDFVYFQDAFSSDPIELLHGPLTIDSQVEIRAVEEVTITGNGESNLFVVEPSGRLVLEGLNLTSGGVNRNGIGVNFATSFATVSSLDSLSLAGVTPVTNWNNVTVGAGNTAVNVPATALQNELGEELTATVAVNLSSSFVGESGAVGSDPNSVLMRGYVSWDPVDGTNPEDTGLITVAGLGSEYTEEGYRVVVYFDSDQNNRTFNITVGGQTVSAADASTFAGVFLNAAGNASDANYAVFDNLSAADFTIEVDSNTGRAAVNGFQILANSFSESRSGGAIDNAGELVLRRCSLYGNSAVEGGAIANEGSSYLDHVTISENSANVGGALYNSGLLEFESCTIAGNTSASGFSGVWIEEGSVAINRSIVELVSDPTLTSIDSLVGSVEEAISPQLNSLGAYTGITLTMPPFADSPAVDAVQELTGEEVDQRGFPRTSGATRDIGAVELQSLLVKVTGDNALPGEIAEIDFSSLSLRDAVRAARDASPAERTLKFDNQVFGGSSAQTIELTEGAIDLSGGINIDASDLFKGVRIDGGGTSGVLLANSGSVALDNLTISGGNSANGGGINMEGDAGLSVRLTNCTVSDNSGANGGGIHNVGGSLFMENCTVSSNSASNRGGGIHFSEGASVILRNTTVAENMATDGDGFGGAVFAGADGATLLLNQVTIAENEAVEGGGVYSEAVEDPGFFPPSEQSANLAVINSIVAQNTAPTDADISGEVDSEFGANLIGGEPELRPLGNYGGPTETMPPLFGSPVVDAALTDWLSPENDSYEILFAGNSDQRGRERTSGFGLDIGACELDLKVVNTLVDENDGADVGGVSLREAVVAGAEGVLFDPMLSGGVIALSNGQIEVLGEVCVSTGELLDGITIDGGGASRIFNVDGGDHLSLSGLTLTNGLSSNEGGAILVWEAKLEMLNCTLHGNGADNGGALFHDRSEVSLRNCTLSDNHASTSGGAIGCGEDEAITTLENCTLSRNSAVTSGGAILAEGTFSVRNSIIAGNMSPVGENFVGTLSLGGGNLTSGDALLAPLGDYGGLTPVHPLLPGSPALEAGVQLASTLPVDQLGSERSLIAVHDLGAVEGFFVDDRLRRAGLFVDSDGDNIADVLEGAGGSYSHLTVGIDDSELDFDGDGRTDANEILAITNPFANSDKLEISEFLDLGLDVNTGMRQVRVTWSAVPKASYQIRVDSVLDNTVAPVRVGLFSGSSTSLTSELELDAENAFFRVERVPEL